ncbi:MAG: diacylglycerol kinase family protein [Bryobacteraceae bacterium]
MLRLQVAQFAHHCVVFRICDGGLIQDVIQVLMVTQGFAEFFDPRGGIFWHRPFHYNLYEEDWSAAITAGRKTIIIYNPSAGKMGPAGLRRLTRAAEILKGTGYDATLVPTTGPGTAGEIARRGIAEGAQLVLAAGGDGTINEVAEGVAFSYVPLGILPAGTANVLANEMGLGSRLERVAARLSECVPTRISIGRLTCTNGGERTRHFLLMAGIGLDAKIVYNISVPLKARIGKVAYWIAGFSLLGRRLDEFELEVDGRRIQCSFALISKVRNYGGDLEIAQDTSLIDDRFEIVLFQGSSSVRYLKYLTRVALRRLDGVSGVEVLRATRVCVPEAADRRIYIQIDGEYAGRLPARLELLPDALTLLIPPGYLGKHTR